MELSSTSLSTLVDPYPCLRWLTISQIDALLKSNQLSRRARNLSVHRSRLLTFRLCPLDEVTEVVEIHKYLDTLLRVEVLVDDRSVFEFEQGLCQGEDDSYDLVF